MGDPKPQTVVFGSQPLGKDAEVQYGTIPVTAPPDAQSGVVPSYAGGSPVPHAHADDHGGIADRNRQPTLRRRSDSNDRAQSRRRADTDDDADDDADAHRD